VPFEKNTSSKQRLGGLAVAAKYDPLEYTAKARRIFHESFLEQVDPDGELRRSNPKEAERRAEAARKFHYARMAFNRAKARKQAQKREPQPAEVA
jgi:hypothetical protein